MNYLSPRRMAHLASWCNGNTAVFGTVFLGSSPSEAAFISFIMQ